MPWLTRQDTVEASTCGGADDSLLSHQLDGHLASTNSTWTATRVYLAAIPSADEALRDLGTFALVEHLFYAGGRPSFAFTELLRLITKLE